MSEQIKQQPINPQKRVVLEVRTSRKGEETVEKMVQFLSSLATMRTRFLYFWRKSIPLSLEMSVMNQSIRFFITVPARYQTFIESQLTAQYPKAFISRVPDYMPEILKNESTFKAVQLRLAHSFLYPLRTYKEFKDVDPLSSLLGILSKTEAGDMVGIQILLIPISNGWHRKASQATSKSKSATGETVTNPYSKQIADKASYFGFKCAIRLAVNSISRQRSSELLYEISNSFSSFNNPQGNYLVAKRPVLWQKSRIKTALLTRGKRFVPIGQILNIAEIATIFHFPGEALSTIHNILWYKTILSDPPEKLPVAEGMDEEEKKDVNFFAKTDYKNKQMIFGVKSVDRRKHVYIIGKTGTGKSTLIANMAINDMRQGRGFAIIDPHGDLCETVLQYVPSYRVNDIVYLNPADSSRSFSLNPLEIQNPEQKELVVSGIVAIFHKLYGTSWGPRLEYVLRNAILSIIDLPGATLLMVPQILTDDAFREKAVAKLQDPVLVSFWNNEFAKMPAKLKSETISPILNKVGQFISSHILRNILQNPKSTIDLEKIMNEGKILLLNLSQGRLGEDNAALLGAMTITKMQLAAMNRVHMKEADRKDFYLYVDEFQNFATSSFIKILSEARKYHLDLILANQYIAQIPEDVRAAIFGNAGTMLSFLVGADDARYLAREFSERFKEEDLLALGNYQAIIKLAIDGITQSPFLCYTLPLPKSLTQNREKVIRLSNEKYTKKIKE